MLAKQYRLRFKKDFDAIFKSRHKFYSINFILRYIKNNEENSKFAFVISKKVSKKAVDRNLIKRRMSEIIRKNISNIKSGYNIIFFAKSGVLKLDYIKIQEELIFIIKRSKLFK